LLLPHILLHLKEPTFFFGYSIHDSVIDFSFFFCFLVTRCGGGFSSPGSCIHWVSVSN
jgi:hypothetical protein